jgi:hypothetical protein
VGVADEVRGRVGKNLVTGVLLGFVLATVPTRSESSTEASIKLLGRNHDVAVIEVTAGASELSIGETWRIVDKVGNHLATTIGSRSASPLNDTTALTPVTTSGKRRVRKWLKIVQPHETAMFVVTVRGLSLSEYVLARGEPATEMRAIVDETFPFAEFPRATDSSVCVSPNARLPRTAKVHRLERGVFSPTTERQCSRLKGLYLIQAVSGATYFYR